MSVFHNNVIAGAAGQGGAAAAEYVIPKSLRFNEADSAHLKKTPSTAGNRVTWTWSAWVKRTKSSVGSTYQTIFSAGADGNTNSAVVFDNSDRLEIWNVVGNANVTQKITSQVFRDFSSWYHFVISATSSTLKLYVNGVEVTDWDTNNEPGGENWSFSGANAHYFGHYWDGGSNFKGDFLLADVQFIDGFALAPTVFGETRSSDGVWVPKEYTGDYNAPEPSFGLSSSDIVSSTGFQSGEGADKVIDSTDPTANRAHTVAGNAGETITVTFDPAVTVSSSLEIYAYLTVAGDSEERRARVNSGAWFNPTTTADTYHDLGFTGSLSTIQIQYNGSTNSRSMTMRGIRIDGAFVHTGGTAGVNGFRLNFSDSSTNEALGFDSAPTVPANDPKKGMDVVTWTGTGSTQNIGGLNFEPGLVWIKSTDNAYDHHLYDSIRGTTKAIFSNRTNAETTYSNGFTSFNPDGFTLGGELGHNGSSKNYVAWTWRAGGPAVSNSDGTITSQVSANTDYGFSIVTYTGGTSDATIGHGLGQTPKFYIVKARTSSGYTDSWNVYHTSLGESAYIKLQSNAAASTPSTIWNETAPTSTVFSVDANSNANEPNTDYVAYVWSEIPGYSKFSSYTGNGSSTGPVIRTGFKVRWLLVKRTDSGSTDNWALYDSERDPANPNVARLFPNLSNAESTNAGNAVDFLDDGFQPKSTSDGTNANNGNYIYIAFADRPGNNWDVNNLVTNEGLTTSKTQFDVVTYTGNGSATSIDSLAFQPDFLWIKQRDEDRSHGLYDSVRGPSKVLLSNSTSAELTSTARIDTIDSAGFTTGSDVMTNKNGQDYVAWCWKAGGTAVSNTDGSITSSVSANAAYGFSIIKFTTASDTSGGATVGHGLGAQPSLYIYKPTSAAGEWVVVSSHDYDQFGYLNDTTQFRSISSQGGGTPADPTNSVLSLYDLGVTLASKTYICYAFANIPGYQRIGSYTGNGSDSGPAVVTGFKPRFVLLKNATDSGDDWKIYDSERDPIFVSGVNQGVLSPNSSSAELQNKGVEFTASGFTVKDSNNSINGSGDTIIYLAIGDDEIGSDEDCLVDVPNAVTADADATDTTGGYQRGNYATMNPLHSPTGSSFSNGNLQVSNSGGWYSHIGTIGVTSGKWYYEFEKTSGSYTGIGWRNNITLDGNPSVNANGGGTYFSHNGNKQSAAGNSSYGATWGSGDIIGVAFDRDAGTIEYYKNGVSQGQAFTGMTDGTFYPEVFIYQSGGVINFGQMRFKYPIPSGYAALNTTALPAATIEDGSDYFDAGLYTGTASSSALAVSGPVNPDFVWIKRRDGATSHALYDAVRGFAERAYSNSTSMYTYGSDILAPTSTGFNLTTSDGDHNTGSGSYIAWQWNAGSSTVSNTDGSITSSVRANPSAGFSIVTWTGNASNATIGHGLNAAPELILLKFRGSTSNWSVYHSAIGNTKRLVLNSTGSTSASSTYWQNTSPTSSVFSVGGDVNDSTTIVAYCFAPVAGYSAFGSYEGTGTSEGAFVFTGMRPAWVMIKRITTAESWVIYDTQRNPFNGTVSRLFADLSNNENDNVSHFIDILSNGFKVRSGGGLLGASGDDYLYAAFAENPFQANGGLAR